ncbi:MAG TPA: SPOR domain-containing protein [Terriglobia bacterium]|nr:SPOR domain-containing protein [Terriglobia bacterium]
MANPVPADSPRSLSVRQLVVIFFLAVAVCAVFFALGFVVGNTQNASRTEPTVEQVAPHSEIPPTVNPSVQESQPPVSESKPGGPTVVEQDLKSGSMPPLPAEPVERSTKEMSSPSPSDATSPSSPVVFVPVRSSEPRGIMIQVAASHAEAHARSLVHNLRARGFSAVLIAPRGARVYRVQVGPFRSRREAATVVGRLRRDGYRPFIR